MQQTPFIEKPANWVLSKWVSVKITVWLVIFQKQNSPVNCSKVLLDQSGPINPSLLQLVQHGTRT